VYESASNQVEKWIINPLESVDVPTVIIIDGLDEWIDDTSQSTILSVLSTRIKEMPKVKLLVTSRPKTHIEGFFPPLLDGLVRVFPLLNTAPDAINKDIRLFLEHELSGLASRNGLDNWPTTVELDLLCSRANGLLCMQLRLSSSWTKNRYHPSNNTLSLPIPRKTPSTRERWKEFTGV